MQLSSLERNQNFGLSIYCHTLYMQEPKALTSLPGCTGMSKSWLCDKKMKSHMLALIFVYYSQKDCVNP